MSILSHFRKSEPIPEHWKGPLAWAVLALIFLAGFGAGLLFSWEGSVAPIIVETSGISGD